MNNHQQMNQVQGHWLLASLGKKVLRPGGLALSKKMIELMDFSASDDVVELAPGLGLTASITLQHPLASYTGVEVNNEAAEICRSAIAKIPTNTPTNIVIADAAATGLDDKCASKIYGEAMLSMQNDTKKSKIIAEAARLLKPGGLYAIHELCLGEADISEQQQQEVRKSLSKVIHVNARPLTLNEWSILLREHGLTILSYELSPMHLLEIKRLIADEGFLGAVQIVINILRKPEARKRVMAMRKVFRENEQWLKGMIIVAQASKSLNT